MMTQYDYGMWTQAVVFIYYEVTKKMFLVSPFRQMGGRSHLEVVIIQCDYGILIQEIVFILYKAMLIM
jgi:hypothetical protein